MTITADANTFATYLSAYTGLDKRVVLAWTLAETGGGTSGVRGFNFLNVGNTDTNPYGGSQWGSPQQAAAGTYQWLQSNPASGAQILGATGKPPDQQLAAIAASPFSSSHYGSPQGSNLLRDYNSLTTAGQVGGIIESLPGVGTIVGGAKSVGSAVSTTGQAISFLGSSTFRYGVAAVGLIILALVIYFRRDLVKAGETAGAAAAVA